MVYVLNLDGQPLMPTERHGKVRRLLKAGKAKIIKRCPFTIQLLYQTGNITQNINLGIDAGSKHIGVSATTQNKVLYESDIELRTDTTKLIATRRYHGTHADVRQLPEGTYIMKSLNRKGVTHRLGFFMIKRKNANVSAS